MDNKTLRKILREELRNFATKGALKNLPTKTDLKVELKSLKDDLESYILDVFTSTDKHKAEKTDVDQLKKQVKRLEKEIFPTM